jgi:hypothetical protein
VGIAGVAVLLTLTIGVPVQEARSNASSKKQFKVSVLALSVVEVTRRFVIVPQMKTELLTPVAILQFHYTREEIKKDTVVSVSFESC